MKLLIKEQHESAENSKICYICKEILKKKKKAKDKKCCKVRDHCHYTEEYRRTVHSMCNLKYNAPKIIPIAFHLKDLAENLKKQFTCLGENTAKCLTFVFLIEKEVARIDKKKKKKKAVT